MCGNMRLIKKLFFCLLLIGYYFCSLRAPSTEYVKTSEDRTEIEKSMPIQVEIEKVARISIVEPGQFATGGPGDILNYSTTISNTGNFIDIIDIIYTSEQGWTYKFFSDPNGDGDPSDGEELKDTDGDGIIDTGEISKDCQKKIVKQAIIPSTATDGMVDRMTMTIKSSIDPSATDSVINTTEVEWAVLPYKEKVEAVLPFAGENLLLFLIPGTILVAAGLWIFRLSK
ncbi:MAG: hypothetical protein QMD66_06280 [Actinomycetota bacterium]|nr:hypothetical protein [Actinomycetota bacterium]